MATDRATRIADCEQRLTEIKAAISHVLRGGQSIAGEGRARTNADLAELRALEKDVRRELDLLRNNGRSIRTYGVAYE